MKARSHRAKKRRTDRPVESEINAPVKLVFVTGEPRDSGVAYEPALIRKLGATSESRLRWLVEDFARRRDYRDARAAALDDDQTPQAVAREVWLFLLYQNGPGTIYSGDGVPEMPARALKRLSEQVESGVARFLNGQEWIVDLPPRLTRAIRREEVLLGRDKGKQKATAMWRERGAWATKAFELTFLLAAQDLVMTEHELLCRCGGCGTVFVREDLRQGFCTPRCAHARWMRDSRAKKKELKSPKRTVKP